MASYKILYLFKKSDVVKLNHGQSATSKARFEAVRKKAFHLCATPKRGFAVDTKLAGEAVRKVS